MIAGHGLGLVHLGPGVGSEVLNGEEVDQIHEAQPEVTLDSSSQAAVPEVILDTFVHSLAPETSLDNRDVVPEVGWDQPGS